MIIENIPYRRDITIKLRIVEVQNLWKSEEEFYGKNRKDTLAGNCGGDGWAVMQQESTGRSLASVSIFGLNGSYTAVATLQKLLQLTCAYRCTHTVARTDRDIVFKRVEIRETVERDS